MAASVRDLSRERILVHSMPLVTLTVWYRCRSRQLPDLRHLSFPQDPEALLPMGPMFCALPTGSGQLRPIYPFTPEGGVGLTESPLSPSGMW